MEYRDLIFDGNETNYIVYENGDIRNKYTWKKLKPRIYSNGYYMVHVTINGVKKLVTVHKLVALTFLPERPSPVHQINHKYGDKLNNYYGDLEWMTPQENSEPAFVNNLSKHGECHYNSKYSNDDVFTSRCYNEMGVDINIISDECNIPKDCLRKIFSGHKRKREKIKFENLFTCSTTILK